MGAVILFHVTTLVAIVYYSGGHLSQFFPEIYWKCSWRGIVFFVLFWFLVFGVFLGGWESGEEEEEISQYD